MNGSDDFALTPRPPNTLEKSGPGAARILAGIVADTLALVKRDSFAPAAAKFLIGDHEWREPDYRQILVWARALTLEPEEVIRRLLRGKKRGSSPEWNETKFANGMLLKLNWDFELLPLQGFEWIDGLAMTHLGFSSSAAKAPTLSLRLPLLTHLSCSNLGLKELDLSGDPMLVSLYGRGTQPDSDGIPFDRKVYEKAKPHFEEVYEKFVQADKSLREFFEFIFEKFGASVRPHLKRFIQELQVLQRQTAGASGVPMLRELWCNRNHLAELDIRSLFHLENLDYDSDSTRLIQRSDQNF
jgi:hypothetical protein